MRRSISLMAVCALLAVLGVAAPALAAGHDSSTRSTTTSHSRTATTASHSRTATTASHSQTATTKATARHHSVPATGAASHVSYATGQKVLNDCQQHGQFTHAWTHAELQKALSMSSAMTNQYSTCNTDLHNALANGIKVKSGGGGGGGSGTTIVIIVVVVLIVLAGLLGGLALRRRGQNPPPTAA